jgi:hypothetical protein
MTSPEMGYVALTQYTDPAVTILTTYFCPFFHGISCLLGTQAPSIRIRLSLQGRPNLTFTKQSLSVVPWAAYEHLTASPAPPPAPLPAWRRTLPSACCPFVLLMRKCMLPTSHPRSRSFMQPSYIMCSQGCDPWPRIPSRRLLCPDPIHKAGYELRGTPLLLGTWVNKARERAEAATLRPSFATWR